MTGSRTEVTVKRNDAGLRSHEVDASAFTKPVVLRSARHSDGWLSPFDDCAKSSSKLQGRPGRGPRPVAAAAIVNRDLTRQLAHTQPDLAPGTTAQQDVLGKPTVTITAMKTTDTLGIEHMFCRGSSTRDRSRRQTHYYLCDLNRTI